MIEKLTMAGGGALNLSLLSRGVGEVQTNGHEKVEVFLEPEVIITRLTYIYLRPWKSTTITI